MRAQVKLLSFGLAVALVAAACSSTSVSSESAAPIAATADGGQLDFGSLEGSDTLLWFWAPW